MKSVSDEPGTKKDIDANARRSTCRQDEEEIARRIEKGINEAKAAVSEKLEDGKIAVERLFRHGRYAMEDGLSELVHTVKRHPVSFLGIAFAAGAVFGILLSRSAQTRETTHE